MTKPRSEKTPRPARAETVAGVRVLTPSARAAMQAAAARPGLRGWRARLAISSDDHRRATAARRAEDRGGDGFDRSLVSLSDRGYRGLGGGRAAVVATTPEWRATTVQVAGLWPFAVGASAPTVGTPVGAHYITGTPVHFDPMSWFLKGFITAPIAFVLGSVLKALAANLFCGRWCSVLMSRCGAQA
jgi:hypothetical protein